MKKYSYIGQEASLIPKRLREARVARSYTLSELARIIDVSAQAISQYEIGTCKPSPFILSRIASALDFPISFFQKDYYETKEQFSNSAVYFRSYKSATKKTREACKVKLSWINEIYHFTQKYIEYPTVMLPQLKLSFNSLEDEIDEESIENLAKKVRNEFQIGNGPIFNLTDILQEHGVIITRFNFKSDKIDAFSAWYDGTPYIILGTDKKSACRLRFDLAHELGHLLLHSDVEDDCLKNKKNLDKIELEANYFAGAFLLPQESFSKELISSSLNQFILLKRKWLVSIQAMIKRAKNLNIINDNQEKYLYRSLNKKGYKQNEPLDDKIMLEKPYLFKQAIQLLIDNKVLSAEEILEEISLSKEEVDSLLMLPDDLLRSDKSISKQPLLRLL